MKQVVTVILMTHFFLLVGGLSPEFSWPDDYSDVDSFLQRQKELEKEVEDLKKELKGMKAGSSAKESEYLQEDVEEIFNRLDKVERDSILDRIRIGGEFRTRMDYLDYKNIEVNGETKDGKSDEIWGGRLRLNLDSVITKNIVFHGRLNYYKLWGDTNFPRPESLSDSDYRTVPDPEGNLHVERAYVDYFVSGFPLSFTFGRHPSADGPPYHFRNYTTRKATWPNLLVNGEYDGIMGTLFLEKYIPPEKSALRLGYARVTQNYQEYLGVELDSMRALFGSFEMEIPGFRDSLAWISYSKLMDYPPMWRLPEAAYVEDIGNADIYNLHVEFMDVKDTGFSVFASAALNYVNARAKGTTIPPGIEIGLYCDSLNGDMGQNRKGHAIYAGFRYETPIDFLNRPLIGFEYNYGSRFWITAAATGNTELINKLMVHGNGYELYYIQPIHEKHMFLRFGGIYLDYEYYNPYIVYGAPRESDRTESNLYFLVDVRF